LHFHESARWPQAFNKTGAWFSAAGNLNASNNNSESRLMFSIIPGGTGVFPRCLTGAIAWGAWVILRCHTRASKEFTALCSPLSLRPRHRRPPCVFCYNHIAKKITRQCQARLGIEWAALNSLLSDVAENFRLECSGNWWVEGWELQGLVGILLMHCCRRCLPVLGGANPFCRSPPGLSTPFSFNLCPSFEHQFDHKGLANRGLEGANDSLLFGCLVTFIFKTLRDRGRTRSHILPRVSPLLACLIDKQLSRRSKH
jgi:hypothetical protein